MLVWIIMFVCNLLIPLTMIIFGLVFIFNAPAEINSLYGYRTPRSMSSLAAWQFAHRYFGRLWAIIGAIILVPSIVLMLMLLGVAEPQLTLFALLITVVQALVMLVPVIPTELALKTRFGE